MQLISLSSQVAATGDSYALMTAVAGMFSFPTDARFFFEFFCIRRDTDGFLLVVVGVALSFVIFLESARDLSVFRGDTRLRLGE